MKRVREVLLLHNFQLPVVACLLAVSIAFVVFPEALDHTALSFEKDESGDPGVIHHVWHYTMMVGSLLALVGLLARGWRSSWALRMELAGLILLIGMLTVNLIASIDTGLDPTIKSAITGLGLALRVGVILGLAVRAYILLDRPVVEIRRAGRQDDT